MVLKLRNPHSETCLRVVLFALICQLAAVDTVVAETAESYVVRAVTLEPSNVEPPVLPDINQYNAQAVRDKLGNTDRKANISYQRLVEVDQLYEFAGGDNRLLEWARRQPRNPRAIVVEGGYATPQDLVAALPAEDIAETEPGAFLLRLPLLISHNATFHIDSSTQDFRMSEERGAFLVNDGRLFVTDSAITAWREAEDGPALFRGGKDFRPFLLAWGGTETYIVNSRISSLGYAASKSYGVSISQYSPGLVRKMNRIPPEGWILDSEFVDNWYGFYCYEANNIVIARNVYRDNIVYGIDPHDITDRLVIAENEVFGTKKRHGIIGSREVNHSWIFHNRSYNNKLSGIVLDRSSRFNVVADNISYGNGSDGITIYESSDNLIWGNLSVANGRHGIRVRNSVGVRLYHNRSIANGLTGVYGHTKDLTGTGRDLKLDPFEPFVSLDVVGGLLANNGSGPITIKKPEQVMLYDVRLRGAQGQGLRLGGSLEQYQATVLDFLVRQRVPVILERSSLVAGEGLR